MKINSTRIVFTVTLWLTVSSVLAQPPLRICEGSSSYGKTTMTVTGNQVRLGNSILWPSHLHDRWQ